MRLLLPIFIGIPILEMFILIQVAGFIGALPTIGLVLLTAVVGLHLLRQQGLSTLLRARQKMADGQLPAEELVSGILLAVGGALLLTPGFFTDSIGFCCLLPSTRRWLVQLILRKGLLQMLQTQGFNSQRSAYQRSQDSSSETQFGFSFDAAVPPDVKNTNSIDGECSPVDEDKQLGQ